MSKSRVNLSCTAPQKIAAQLQKIAESEDQTVSRIIAKAVAQYVAREKKNGHPALVEEDENNKSSSQA